MQGDHVDIDDNGIVRKDQTLEVRQKTNDVTGNRIMMPHVGFYLI